jgi:hypothetical protein
MIVAIAAMVVLAAVDPDVPAVPAEAVRGWSAPAFSIPPRQLLALATRARRDLAKRNGDSRADLTVWHSEEHEIRGGRVTVRSHIAFSPMTERGVNSIAMVRTNRPGPGVPRIGARVVSPKGDAMLWDSDAISKLPQAAPGVWESTAWLPGVSPGCVVEMVSVLEDSKPLLPGGFSSYVWFQDDVWAARVRVAAPSSSPLRGLTSGVAGAHQREKDRGKIKEIEWTAGPQRYSDPAHLGGPEAPRPFIAWTTWKTWSQISAQLAEGLEPRIKPSAVADVAAQVAGDATSPEEIAARLFSHVERNLTFEKGGLQLTGLLPKPTADILKSPSASGLDRAALLVAALRARGLQADIALVQWLFHMSNELPALDNFDTPLVMITGPGLKGPIWLDVMYGKGPNDVTIELGGKRALPIRVKGADLVALPRSTRAPQPR